MKVNKFELSKMRNVGIMSIHNLTGDFESGFGIVSPTELPLVPTASGITFFRWHSPLGKIHEKAANEVRFFKAVHEGLKAEDGRGLSTVVVFAENFYRQTNEALIIAEGVKDTIDPKISVVAYTYNLERELIRARKDGYINGILLADLGGNNEAKFMQHLGLPVSQHAYQASQEDFRQLYSLFNDYLSQYPLLFTSPQLQPEKLYLKAPETPPGRHQLAWNIRLGLT